MLRTLSTTLTAATVALTAAPLHAQVCADFDPPGAGSWPCCGALFNSDGITFRTEPFQWVTGAFTAGGQADIVPACNGAPGHSLWTNNVQVEVRIPDFFGTVGVRRIKFWYEDFGGNVNLRVNGLNAFAWDNYHNIPAGFFAGAGVNLIVPPPVWTGSSWRGSVILEAAPGSCITEFATGGQELCLDDVCAEEACPAVPCPADIDGDGTVGFADLLAALAAWGACGACPEDLDGDGFVSFPDLLAILAAWGPC